MANPDHLKLLEHPPDHLKRWRRTHPDEVLDFTGAELKKRNFDRWDLSGADFSSADLSDCSMQHTFCNGANFREANLSSANFTFAKLEGADLSKADLRKGQFERADMTSAILKETIARDANFDEVMFFFAKLDGIHLERSSLQGAHLDNIDFGPAQLLQVNLARADLKGAKLSKVNLKNANFQSADLTDANLKGSKLDATRFNSATLIRCSLDDTSLVRSVLSGANLESASLVGANLTRADLTSAKAPKANFSGANFYECTLNRCDFDQARGLERSRHLETALITPGIDREQYFGSVELPWTERFVSWEKIRWLGRLPLFAASYSAVIVIPFLYYLLDAYNRHVTEAREWAALAAKGADPPDVAKFILNHLRPEPIPDLSLILLGSTISLAIGATIFAACPSRIREFSRDQWTDELDRSLAHYWAVAWKWRAARLLCVLLYIVGGVGALWVLVSKLCNTFIFIVRNW